MASKLQEYRRMSEEAQRQLTGSLERWQSFLATASRLYKYPYHEQVMIHAQRPDATACAEFDVWNNTMRRYVRRGSKGIALIDTSGDRERLRYVFDVSDTGTRPNSRSLNLWELREEHIPAVSSMLEKNYGVPAGESLAVQLEAVASQLAREYWEDNRRDILGILEDSFLEEYDEFNVGVAFRNAAEVSISYSLMLRCGLEPENYFEHEDFMSVFDFNTPETAGALGTAVSGINQQVLREIGATIRNYEREQIAERSMAYENDVQAERGLSDPGHQTERAGGYTHREVRADEEAQKVFRKIRKGYDRSPDQYLLRSLVHCGACGRTMQRQKHSPVIYYTCLKSVSNRETACPVGERFVEADLERIVKNDLIEKLRLLVDADDRLYAAAAVSEGTEENLRFRPEQIEKRMKQISVSRVSAYERYAEGRLQRDIYLMERDKLNAENDSLSSEKERLEKELLALSQSRNRELTETCDMARQTLTADELTNEMLLFFIDRVNVYSGMRVEIIYHFSDEIARLIEQENTAE